MLPDLTGQPQVVSTKASWFATVCRSVLFLFHGNQAAGEDRARSKWPKGYSLLKASLGTPRDTANSLGFVSWGPFISGVSSSRWQTKKPLKILIPGLTASIQRPRGCGLASADFLAEREGLASECWNRNRSQLSTVETAAQQGGASTLLLTVRFPRKQSH